MIKQAYSGPSQANTCKVKRANRKILEIQKQSVAEQDYVEVFQPIVPYGGTQLHPSRGGYRHAMVKTTDQTPNTHINNDLFMTAGRPHTQGGETHSSGNFNRDIRVFTSVNTTKTRNHETKLSHMKTYILPPRSR